MINSLPPLFFLGIDPGRSGGMALLRHPDYAPVTKKPVVVAKVCLSKLKTPRSILYWLDEYANLTGRYVAVMERVGGYISSNFGIPGMGSAMFNFGKNFGWLEMALASYGIPYSLVSPATWQRGLGITPRGKKESKSDWKQRLASEARKRFPNEKITLATADALLLAEYCRRLSLSKQQAKQVQ